MVNPQDTGPAADGQEPLQLPTSPKPKVEGNASPKMSHPLEEDNDGSVSPPSKKRRLDSEPQDLPAPPQQAGLGESAPGDQIEEELASALGSGVMDTVEHQSDLKNPIETPAETAMTTEGAQDIDPEMASVISSIMNHAERVEEQCAIGQQQAADTTTSQPAPKGMIFVKANSHLKIQSLPILDNLSTQILSLLAKSTYQDITSFVSEPDSENGQAYATMRSLFDHTRRVYSTKKSFLSATELELTEPAQIDIIRKANLASFVSSIFGTQEIGFSELNDNFLDVFVPEGGRLLKVQGALFLELKTQAFIASMNNTERSRTELLYDLFPDDLEQQLLDRRPGTRQLAPSESDFVKRAGSRRDILLSDINNEEAMKALPDKYHWEDFLRDLSSYITKNFDMINNQQPTQVLYERARMAASAKSSPSSRKSGLPSQRRPWTTEEENALMAGLDRVKGPHWSQILAMFGPGGTISEALKDRNQVQLKDKARNLKLFFLKSGIEVPYYLKFVTGELKTRAPAQAAKREARERQKKQGEEDKAHVEGIKGMMALAGAHPQPVAMGHDAMSASPSLPPDPASHAAFDQTAEQNLMQTLGQEN
ncbi:hypothetical protein ATERTT37_003708 [Aspergillus terreus]